MRPQALSLVATGVAAVLFVAAHDGVSDAGLRGLGALGGGALALAGVALGALRHRVTPTPQSTSGRSPVGVRFFLDRRRAPRHDVSLPVRFAVNGHTYPATLVSVGAQGALLRLRDVPGEPLRAQVGQLVRIEDYPAGTLARIGRSGVYVDFAVQFDSGRTVANPDPQREAVLLGRSARG